MFHLRPYVFFFFNDTATTEIYTLSLHDALPIYDPWLDERLPIVGALNEVAQHRGSDFEVRDHPVLHWTRSEEHTSELQSRQYLVCRLLLEKKKLHVLQ